MIDEAQITVRNVGLLIAQRGFYILGSFVFAALIPRTMGPGNYGRFALLVSLSLWFVLFSNLSLAQIMGRFVPQLRLQGDRRSLQKLFNNLVTVSLLSGFFATCLCLLIATLWLTDLDLILLATMAAAVLVRACSIPFFALFLGLNRTARWGMSEIIRRWLSIIFLFFGFYFGGLQGACLGFLLTELIVLSIGIWWGRSYFSWSAMRLDLRYLIPYLRFGLIFYIIQIIQSTLTNSGAVVIKFFHNDYAQVSYFSLAYSASLTASAAISQFTLAFAPFMVTLLGKGKIGDLQRWTENLLKWLAMAGVLSVFSVILLADDLVPLLFGNAYRPVAINLLPLSLALVSLNLTSVATLLAIVYNQPNVALTAAGIRLVAFWGFGVPLVTWWGGLGACLALLRASVFSAGYCTRRMQNVMGYSLQKWLWASGLGVLFLPLMWFRSSWMVNLALYGLFVTGYTILLLFLRVTTLKEVRGLWHVISSRERISDLRVREE
jgi:O-antigen/teichoic acid export membrane protein